MTKLLYITFGSLCVFLGIAGIFLPVLPTTPFFLLAAFCYSKSSQRFLQWLLYNPIFGDYIRNYRAGLGMPLREKIISISLLWITIGFSILHAVSLVWLKILLVLIAICVTIHLIKIKTY